ncbi:MAG: TatD family hydrolase [Acidimicrobiia bacterium]|nr:TatD family hydrolase [Acidimicrobiia bacterium]
MSGWVDSHCHLQVTPEPDALLARAHESGVDWVMCPGIDLATSESAAVLARRHDTVLWSAGLHPHEASAWGRIGDRIAELAENADAIGECGLDYYRNLAPREDQLGAFRAQLSLAAELDKPIIIHCRDAFTDVHAELEGAGLGASAILHCWTGGPRWTKRFRELGVTFSFAGPITYPTGDTVRYAAAEAPPESTMVETDTPYLTPPPNRHEPNEPANVVRVGMALADVWGVEPAEVAVSTSAVAASVFGR